MMIGSGFISDNETIYTSDAVLKNAFTLNKVTVASTRKKKIVAGIIAGVLIAGIFGGAGFGIGKAFTSQPPVVASVYEQEYKEYSRQFR